MEIATLSLLPLFLRTAPALTESAVFKSVFYCKTEVVADEDHEMVRVEGAGGKAEKLNSKGDHGTTGPQDYGINQG